MVKLNKSEMMLYNFVRDSNKKETEIGDLISEFYKDRKKPKHPNGSMAAMMRTIAIKTAAMGLPPLVRTSRLGSKSKATYKVGLER